MARNLFAEGEILAPKKGRNLFSEGELLAPKQEPSRKEQIRAAQKQLTPQQQFVSSLMSEVAGWNKSVGDTAHGIMQPMLEGSFAQKHVDPILNKIKEYIPEKWAPYNGTPLAEASKKTANERNQIYETEKELNPLNTLSGFAGGEISKALPAAYAARLGLLPLLGGPTLAAFLGGGISGGLSGASKYVNPGESRKSNAATGFLAGLATPLGNAGYNTLRSYPASRVANRINQRGLANEAHYAENLYPGLFNDVERVGGGHVPPPDLDYGQLMHDNPGDLAEVFRNYLGTLTPRSAHVLQSDIGKEVARLQRKSVTSGLNSIENANLQRLNRADRSVNNSLSEALAGINPEFANRYGDITRGYRRDVIPYTRSPSIGKFRDNELGNREFLKKLTSEEKFMHQAGREHHPELNIRKYLPLSLAGGAGYYHRDKLYNLINAFGGNND